MLRFLFGIVLGAALSFGSVKWGGAFFDVVGLPDRLRGNIVSSASDSELYELEQDAGTRRRALAAFFANQAEFAALIDAESGYPFLSLLHRRRATREAEQLYAQWQAFDLILDKPALRQTLERKHATKDTLLLKREMLAEALARQPFLQAWIVRHHPGTAAGGLLAVLAQIAGRRDQR